MYENKTLSDLLPTICGFHVFCFYFHLSVSCVSRGFHEHQSCALRLPGRHHREQQNKIRNRDWRRRPLERRHRSRERDTDSQGRIRGKPSHLLSPHPPARIPIPRRRRRNLEAKTCPILAKAAPRRTPR